jgi:hypothetical protein
VEDVAVFARALDRYEQNRTVANFQVTVLAQRVVIEKAKGYYKRRGQMGKVAQLIGRVISDTGYRKSLGVCNDGAATALARLYPDYLSSGLIGGKE